MLTSYHNHTSWSDGKASLREMIAAAEKSGIGELGISDHFVFCPDHRNVDWAMKTDFLPEYLREIDLASGSSSINILAGLEVDFFPETVGILRSRLDGMVLDYLIGSVHFIGKFQLDAKKEDWADLTEPDIEKIWLSYWSLVGEMARSKTFDIVGHLDLPKKFGYSDSRADWKSIGSALDSIADSGMTVEINTSGWSFPAREAYPSLEILKAARKRDIPIMINSDAHRPEHLARNFQRARSLAREAGYSEVVRYTQRQRSMIEL